MPSLLGTVNMVTKPASAAGVGSLTDYGSSTATTLNATSLAAGQIIDAGSAAVTCGGALGSAAGSGINYGIAQQSCEVAQSANGDILDYGVASPSAVNATQDGEGQTSVNGTAAPMTLAAVGWAGMQITGAIQTATSQPQAQAVATQTTKRIIRRRARTFIMVLSR